MSLRAHDDQIALPLVDPADDLLHRLVVGEKGIRRNAGRSKIPSDLLEVCGVFRDLRADRISAEHPRPPAIRHVKQHHPALHDAGQRFDVLDDGKIGRAAIQRDEDGVIHLRTWKLALGELPARRARRL